MSEASKDVSARLGLGPDAGRAKWRVWAGEHPYLAGGIALGFALFVIWWLFLRGPAAPEYVSEPVVRGDLKVIVTATGTVEPETSVTVGSEISGRIDKVLADFNDQVKKDQVLAEIDTTALRNTLAKSEATLDESRATVLQYQASRIEAAAKWKRYKSLAAVDAVSKLELDMALADMKRAEANYAGGQARVKANEAQLAADQTSLSKAVIRSPIDGVVIERKIEPGQTVAATFETPTLFTLADDLRHMELQVNVDEADVGQVREGQSASFSVDAYPNRRFQAVIKKLHLASTTTNNVVSYVAVLSIDNGDLALRPGMTATAEIVTAEKKNVLLVPNGATRFTPADVKLGENAVTTEGHVTKPVWILKDGEPQSVALDLGLTNGQQTEVLSGDVTEGMSVLTDIKVTSKEKGQ